MEKKRTEKTTTYSVVEATPAAMAIVKAICDACASSDIEPEDTLAVLGEAVIRFLIPVAEYIGYDKKDIIKVFADGIASARLDF